MKILNDVIVAQKQKQGKLKKIKKFYQRQRLCILIREQSQKKKRLLVNIHVKAIEI